jgi:hypothetical protein
MHRLRPALIAAVAAGFVAGGVGGAIALHPGAAPAKGNSAAGGLHQPVPAEFRTMVNQMSATNIKATINKLVSFGTRQTLSSQTDPNRGIGAARDWIFQTLQGYAAASGGRMTVAEQPFIQPNSKDPDARNPRDTKITNIVATLKGTQPQQPGGVPSAVRGLTPSARGRRSSRPRSGDSAPQPAPRRAAPLATHSRASPWRR